MMVRVSFSRCSGSHRLIGLARGFDPLRRVFRGRMLASQDEKVEGRELIGVEAQRERAVRHLVEEVGAGPVDHRHEIVADGVDAVRGQRADRLAVGVEMLLPVAGAGLDLLGDRDALDHRPAHAAGFHFRIALGDVVNVPGGPVRDVMQSRHDAGRARLPYMLQGNLVLRAEPAPGLFHAYFSRECTEGIL
jgi:hypothetical protein